MGLVVLLVRPRASLGDVAGLQPAGDVEEVLRDWRATSR